MSVHSEITDHSPEKKFIADLCSNRWMNMKNPCKGCRYRYPISEDDDRCCMFPTCPRDWQAFERSN